MVVEEITHRVPPLHPNDRLSKASEAIRVSPAAAVPVAEDGRILGLVSARDLKELLGGCPPEQWRTRSIGSLLDGELFCVPGNLPVDDALAAFRDHDLDAAPVLDEHGRYLGVVGTGALLSAVCGGLRPPMIGGLATPLGVYLTNGVVRAGVGDLALVSAGFFMGLLQLLAAWGATALTPTLVAAAQLWRSNPMVADGGSWLPAPADALTWLPPVLTIIFFSVLFRLSWVTGYHAAEHQVVHAIEQGDELSAESVRSKPRVHPRCGTNLMAAFILFMVLHGGLPTELSWLAFPVALIAWRGFGSFLQQYITTKPATERQIESGLYAARQLLERYQSCVTEQPSRGRRLWNIGLLQVLGGFFVLWTLLWVLDSLPFLNTRLLDYLGS
jgi:CBS domain-containing protein